MPGPYKYYKEEDVKKYGFEAVPRDQKLLFENHPTASGPNPKVDNLTFEQIEFPDTELIRKVKAFVQEELPVPTYNHSNRVYVWGISVWKTHFPHWTIDLETWYLSCLFHDIGTAENFQFTNKMSFEFKGAIAARDFILKYDGVEDQADSVCEAIIRHQDIFVDGFITTIGQLLQIATLLDNAGQQANLISPGLLSSTLAEFPRLKWSGCFSKVIYAELDDKPWCHTSSFEKATTYKQGEKSNFANAVEGNTYMNKFE